jgi:pimeloyl-ACP methyl ester carboxylesterase
MTLTSAQFIDVEGDGGRHRVAWRQTPAGTRGAPGLLWLNGFTSTMTSTKVGALADWCEGRGLRLTRFDYLGHGESGGDFADGTISLWLADARAVFERLTDGPQILIGSSMGGWIAMLLLRHHLASLPPGERSRIAGLVLIAPALDLTEDLIWNVLDDAARQKLLREGALMRADDSGGPGTPITRAFIEDGRRHLLGRDRLAPGCPVRILQGRADTIVPWQHALKTLDVLDESDSELLLIEDGDHRLSRPQDIRRLIRMVEDLLTSPAESGPS